MANQRYFEVSLKQGAVMVLSENEIKTYREHIDEVRTEFAEEEILKMNIEPLTVSNIQFIKSLKII